MEVNQYDRMRLQDKAKMDKAKMVALGRGNWRRQW
jgi:hypothetical protein